MHDEISAAVLFLIRLIEKGENFNQVQLEEFKNHLSELLTERFENHWFPELPYKGQGYRCIRVNERDRRDASLEEAARASGIKYEDMKLPVELTIWVDPNEVCCRFGENKGSYCTLASFNDKDSVISETEGANELSSEELKEVAITEESVPDIVTKTVKQSSLEKVSAATSTTKTPDSSVVSSVKEKPQVLTPLSSNNPRHHGGRKHSGSPKQKSGGRRGGNMPGPFTPHHPLQSWYNIISPHWMSPSPPPYHPMLRSGSKWGGAPIPPHHRYHWSNKSMLKV